MTSVIQACTDLIYATYTR